MSHEALESLQRSDSGHMPARTPDAKLRPRRHSEGTPTPLFQLEGGSDDSDGELSVFSSPLGPEEALPLCDALESAVEVRPLRT